VSYDASADQYAHPAAPETRAADGRERAASVSSRGIRRIAHLASGRVPRSGGTWPNGSAQPGLVSPIGGPASGNCAAE
jgi:hypothetical protein